MAWHRQSSCRPSLIFAVGVVVVCFASVSASSLPDLMKGAQQAGVAKPMQLVETTLPPDDDPVTTPPVGEVVPTASILLNLEQALTAQLRIAHHQWLNALVAFLFGMAAVIDGEFVFKWLIIGGVFIVATLIAHNETAAFWSLGEKSWLRRFTGVEVGVIVAYNAMRGFEGLMIVLAALFGMFVSFGIQTTLVTQGVDAFKTVPWLVVSMYSLITLFFAVAVVKKKHVRALGILSSLLGGALVSSAVFWFATYAIEHGWVRIQGMTASPGAWVDFFTLLTGKHDRDVGVLAGSQGMNKFSSSGWPGDRICGCALWFALSAVGTLVQFRRAQQKVTTVNITAAREPLLPKEA